MTSLQGPGRQNSPEPFADLLARLEQMRRELGDMTSSVLKSAGIRVSDQGMTIQSALEVDGPLDVSGAATFSGNTTIGGDAAITGTLSLPAGIIDNEALAKPILFASAWGGEYEFGTPAEAWTEVASVSITIPPGFTKFQFTSVGMVNMTNTGSITSNMYTRIVRTVNGVGAFSSQRGQIALPAGFPGVANCFYLWNESVNPGDVHRYSLQAWTSGAFAADAYNYANVDVQALFSR